GEELVTQPLPLAGAFDDASDVHEGHSRRDLLLAAEDLGEPAEALTGQRHHPDVRLDGGERVVRREHGRTGEGVEERRLAHVGQAGDTESQGHGSPVYGRTGPDEHTPGACCAAALSAAAAPARPPPGPPHRCLRRAAPWPSPEAGTARPSGTARWRTGSARSAPPLRPGPSTPAPGPPP